MKTIALLAAAAIALAPPAAAAPEDDYLATLANTPGFTVNAFTGPLLTNAGHTICGDLNTGMTPEDAAIKMLSYPRSVTSVNPNHGDHRTTNDVSNTLTTCPPHHPAPAPAAASPHPKVDPANAVPPTKAPPIPAATTMHA